jgi:subtilisin family serine protease
VAKIGASLRNRLAFGSNDELIEVHIFGRQQPAVRTLATLSRADVVARSRDSLVRVGQALAGAPVRQHWINQSINARLRVVDVRRLLQHPDVGFVEIVRHAPVEALIDDMPAPTSAPGSSPTWSVEKINAPALWKLGLDGSGIVVALIDTGVNYKHPDLAPRMWDGGSDYPLHGYNFELDTDDPIDEQGHGTSCAGIVAGTGAMGTATGVAPGATLMAIRVGGSESHFWSGMQFALEHGADVISMSMTWKYDTHPDYTGWRRVSETILAAGVLHANSSGNQGAQPSTYPVPWNIGAPGNCPPPRATDPASAISCGSTNSADEIAFTSGLGPSSWNASPYDDYDYVKGDGLIKPDLCAPGEGSISLNYQYGTITGASAYAGFGGTSAATPHVGGALAILAQATKRAGNAIDASRIQEALEATAVRVQGQTDPKQNTYGAGRIDLLAAYDYGLGKQWWR